MICPLKFNLLLQDWINREEWNCEQSSCQAWEPQAKYNPKTKQYEGDCRLFMLDRKVSGGINTHPF